ncbi:MAG TPA: PP2C family protein-serine/threonine phosphatase, partial [Streptomyces sp.]|nr:PP2C family protein-serine/threonine phosphatase [Streptomyces sp.]
MTACPDVWKISTAVDAARVRTLAARLAAEADLPVREQARLLSALTGQLRRCLADGEVGHLLVEKRPPACDDAHGTLRIAVRPAGHPPQEPPPWELTVACREPGAHRGAASLPEPATVDEAALAEALLAADDSVAQLLTWLDEQEELVRFHREELHHTNQGVLALHAELDAAARGQRAILDAERAARAEAERARRLLTFLTNASAAVTASLDQEDIVERLSGLLVPDYAAHVDVWLFDDETTPAGAPRPAAAVAAARTGRPQHAAAHPGGLPDVDDLPPSALAPDRPLLCIPLLSRSLQGVLSLTAPDPAPAPASAPGSEPGPASGSRFDADTSVMLIELARRAAIALDNARRYEQHRDTAQALQRAQLTDLPATDGVRLAARYLPATRGLNIGGDWYDAFVQPDGSLLAVIGDVTGHGLHAAVMMGQLRTALRAYAVEDDSPARILTRLHRMLCHQQPALYATALIARIRPDDPQVVWAAAGHPPAVARSPEGTVRLLDARPGVMLGVPLPYTYEDHSAELPPGSTLALYTDGLVE